MEKERSCPEADKGQGEFRMREPLPVFGASRIELQNSGTEKRDLEVVIDTLEPFNELNYSEKKDTELIIKTMDLTFIGLMEKKHN